MGSKLQQRLRRYQGPPGKPLTPGQKAVLMALAYYGREDGTQIYPGRQRLADETGYSVRQVIRLLQQLEEKKVITPVSKVGGRGHTTHYIIPLDSLFGSQAQKLEAPGAPPPDEPFLPDESPQLGDFLPPATQLEERLERSRATLQQRLAQRAHMLEAGQQISPALIGLIANSERKVAELEEELAQLTSAQREYQHTT